LEELIARQRFSLNRTFRLQRENARSARTDATTVAQLAEAEIALADLTRELAAGYEQLGVAGYEFIYLAEEAMRAAASALLQPHFPVAVAKEKDALAALIKARDTVRQFLKKADQATGRAARAFSRRQAQKIRWPKDLEQLAEQLAAQLRQLQEQEESFGGAAASGKLQRPELEEMQRKIADRAYDVQRVMEGIDRLSELAQTRMNRATQKAEEASELIIRGRTEAAAEAAERAGTMFGELARHVEGLLSGQPPQRIAKARDLATRLADDERQLGDAVAGGGQESIQAESRSSGGQPKPPPSSGKGKEGSDGQASSGNRGARDRKTAGRQAGGEAGAADGDRAEQAARLAETGRTLEDVLSALAKLREPADQQTRAQVERLLGEGKVNVIVRQLAGIEQMFRKGRAADVPTEVRDLAERLESLSAQLDAIYHQVVAPRLEALLTAEQAAADLRARLDQLQSETDISAWHRQADLLIQQLEEMAATDNAAEGLLAAMRAEGWGSASFGGWRWGRADGTRFYAAPSGYREHLATLIDSLQQQAQELLLADMVASGDDAVPPKYEELVKRYFRTLSQDAGKE
jgi:hypothetical protein